MRNNAVLLQHVYSLDQSFMDMARLTYARHSAYAGAHAMDYWHLIGDGFREDLSIYRGGWVKLVLILQALDAGYEYVFWIDTDAAILNMDCDLREALSDRSEWIGAVLHDPQHSDYLQKLHIPAHLNVGALYIRRQAKPLIADWLAQYDGPLGRFLEQGVFNQMRVCEPWCSKIAELPATWNATVNVNDLPSPNVRGWHGIFPNVRRFGLMRAALHEDFLRFRVL